MPRNPDDTQTVELRFPVKGIDLSEPRDRQPEGTCPYALNVVAFPPLSDRRGGGKRYGTARALSSIPSTNGGIFGVHGLQTIVGLSPLTLVGAAVGQGGGGEITAFADDFTGPPTADPADLGANWVSIGYGGSATVPSGMAYYGQAVSAADQLTLDGPGGGTGYSNVGVIGFAWNCTGDVTVTLAANGKAAYTSGDRYAPTDSCTGVGPCVRASAGYKTFVVARLKPTSATHVRLEVSSVSGTTVTDLGHSSPVALDNSASVSTDCVLRLKPYAGGLRATCVWATQSVSLTVDVTGTLPAGSRGGIAAVFDAISEHTGGVSTANYRRVVSVAATKALPTAYTADATLDPSGSGPANFYLPAGWTSVFAASGAAPMMGPASDTQTTKPAYPSVDNSTKLLVGNAPAAAAGTPQFYSPLAAPASLRAIDFTVSPASTSSSNCGGIVSRCSEDFRDFLWVGLRREASATTAAAGCSRITAVTVQVFSDAVATVLATLTPADFESIPFRTDAPLRWYDNGLTVRCAAGGVTLFEYEPTGDGVDALAGNLRLGIALAHTGDASTSPSLAMGRIVSPAGLPGGGPNIPVGTPITQVLPKILAHVDQGTWVGDIAANTILQCTQTANLRDGAYPETASYGGKWYSCDGGDGATPGRGYVVTDPATLTTSLWAASEGTIPDFCYLVAVYRGRMVLARGGYWAASRVGDPLDYDFGADPVATSAISGSNADIGQLADTITALIPAGDDYLIFGGSTSLHIMEGDPGYGGQVQVLSRQTGVIGPRAWCFGESGELYFLGSHGLFRLAGGQLTPLTGRRLYRTLDRLDTSDILVQLVYDAFSRLVHIFLTPSTGAGQHVVYDTSNDGLWYFVYPKRMGPWASCRYVGPLPNDRRFLIGGDDGFIRRPDDSILGDDADRAGTARDAVLTQINFAPFELGGGSFESMAEELEVVGADGLQIPPIPIGPVTWRWLTDDSAAKVSVDAATSARKTGTFFASGVSFAQTVVSVRETGVAHMLALEQSSKTASWGLESILVRLRMQGRKRVVNP